MLVYTHVIFGDKLDSIKIRQCSIHRTLLKWTPLREILLHTMVQLFCTPLLLKTRFCWEEVILMASAIFTYFHRMSVETIMWGFSLFLLLLYLPVFSTCLVLHSAAVVNDTVGWEGVGWGRSGVFFLGAILTLWSQSPPHCEPCWPSEGSP